MDNKELDKLRQYTKSIVGEDAYASSPIIVNGVEINKGNKNKSLLQAGVIANQNRYDVDKEEYDEFLKYGVVLNPGNTREQLERERAENQGTLEQLGNMFGQAIVNEALIGTIKGFSDIFDAAINIANEKDDYTNALSSVLEEWQEDVRKAIPIYQKENDGGFHMGDFGWWMNGAVNAATTVSLMLPGLGTTKAISALGKIGNIGSKTGKLVRRGLKAAKVQNVGKTFKTAQGVGEIGSMVFISRTAENYQEARENYKNVLNKASQELAEMNPTEKQEFIKRNSFEGMSDEEIAQTIAGVTSSQVFRNDYWMLLMDIPQFKVLSSIWKGAGVASKATTRAIRKANNRAIENLVKKGVNEEVAKETVKTFSQRLGSAFTIENLGKGLKNVWNSTEGLMLSEGVEEGFQGIQSQRGEESGEIYFNPYLQRKTLGQYLQDESIWEQAFWGVAGGLLFQGAAKGVRNLGNKLDAKLKKDKLTEDQYVALAAGENKSRIEEINGRARLMDNLIENLKLIEEGKNPYAPIKGDNNQDELVEGKRQYEAINSVEEQEKLKSTAFNDFITNLVLNAADNGNYELLKEFVSNKQFSEYFKESGLDTDAFLENQFLAKADEVYDQYRDAYYDVLDNSDASNEFITRLAARDIVRKRLDVQELTNRINQLQDDISEEVIGDPAQYEKVALSRVINAKIQEIDNVINRLNTALKNRNSYYSKQAYNKEIKRLNEMKDDLYKQLENANPAFNYSEYLKNTLFENDLEEKFREVQELYNSVISQVLDKTPFEKLSEFTQKALYAKANYELYRDELEKDLPNSNNVKDYYKNLYDEKEAMFIDLAESKFKDAYNKIYDYIDKSENPKESFAHLIKDDIAKDKNLSEREKASLQDALDVLTIGSYDRQAFNNAIAFMLEGITNKRNKNAEDSKKVVVDDKKLNDKQSKTIKDDGKTNPSPTGKKQKVKSNPAPNPNPVKEDDNGGKQEIIDDDSYVLPDEGDEFALGFDPKVEKIIAESYGPAYSNDSFPGIVAEDATRKICYENNSLWRNVLKDGINSASYKKFRELVLDEMIVQGLVPSVADQYVESGIAMYIQLAYNIEKRYKFTDLEQNLFNSLSKIIGVNPENGDSMYEGLTPQESLSRKNTYIKEVFDDFVKMNNLTNSILGNKVINLEDVFVKISELFDDKGLNYDTILALYKDVLNFVNTYEGDEYTFVNRDFLNVNFTEFVDNLYQAKTKRREVVSPFMHFDLSNTIKSKIDNNEISQSKILNIIQEARDKDVNIYIARNTRDNLPISIGFKYNNQELGYIALVKANKDNTELSSDYKGNTITLKKNLDGTISASWDNVFDKILNNEKYYKQFACWYIKNHQGIFLEDARSDEEKQSSINILSKAIGNIDYSIRREIINDKDILEYVRGNRINLDGLTDSQKFRKIAVLLSPILFYDMQSRSIDSFTKIDIVTDSSKIKQSIETFKKKEYNNFVQTKNLYDRLEQEGEIVATLKSDSAGKIRYDHSRPKNVNRLQISTKTENYPFVFYDNNGGQDENGKTYMEIRGLKNGSMGIVMGENQGSTFVDENGMIVNTPGANLALIVDSNPINSNTSKLAGILRNATKDYLSKIFDEYNTKISSGRTIKEKDSAFDELYNNLNDLFGNSFRKVFNNIFIATNGGGDIHSRDTITIFRNINGKREVVVKIYKYRGLVVENGVRKTKNGKILKDDELLDYYKGAIDILYENDNSRLFDLNKKENKEKLSNLYDFILDSAVFNKTFFAKKAIGSTNYDGKHLRKSNGKFILEVGEFKKEFDNFTQMATSLNMYKTSQIGNKNNRYDYDKIPDSFYVQIEQDIAPKTEKEKEEDKGIAGWIKENDITPEDDVQTFEVLDEFLPSDLSSVLKTFNNELKKINNNLFANTLRLNVGLSGGSYGRYEGGKILIGTKTITKASTASDGWKTLFRVILHENIHRIVEQEDYFGGEVGLKRANDLKETFELFYSTLSSDKTQTAKDLKKKYNKFKKDLYDTIIEGDEKQNERTIILANEWISEVMSDNLLRDYLNEIQTGETIIVDNEEKHKTLLQKILDFICKLFNKNNAINNNTLLAKINNLLNDNTYSQVNGELVVDEQEHSDEEIHDEDKTKEELDKVDEDNDGTSENDTYDVDVEGFSLDSNYEGLTVEEVKLKDFNDDKSVNIFGVENAPNMNIYLSEKSREERADLVSAMRSNELEYICSM